MINNNSNALSLIKEIVSKLIPESEILLFGSRARNENSSESDYDFLIITEEFNDISVKRALKSMLRKELAQLKIPADILIYSKEEIAQKKEINGHILKQVFKEGIAL